MVHPHMLPSAQGESELEAVSACSETPVRLLCCVVVRLPCVKPPVLISFLLPFSEPFPILLQEYKIEMFFSSLIKRKLSISLRSLSLIKLCQEKVVVLFSSKPHLSGCLDVISTCNYNKSLPDQKFWYAAVKTQGI